MSFRFLILAAVLTVWALAGLAIACAQLPTQPTPLPTPRRPLSKPVGGTRGFELYAGRDASARLIAASSTRNINERAASSYNRGKRNYDAGKYFEAVRDFAKAVTLDPKSPEAHYALARALTQADKLQEAIDEFKRVLKFNLTNELKIWSYVLMANAYADLGQYKGAIEAYEQAIRLDPTLSKPHNSLGLAYAASGQLSEAAAEFNQAVQLKSDYAEAHYDLGVAYFQMGKKREAEEQQRVLAKLKPELSLKLEALLK